MKRDWQSIWENWNYLPDDDIPDLLAEWNSLPKKPYIHPIPTRPQVYPDGSPITKKDRMCYPAKYKRWLFMDYCKCTNGRWFRPSKHKTPERRRLACSKR